MSTRTPNTLKLPTKRVRKRILEQLESHDTAPMLKILAMWASVGTTPQALEAVATLAVTDPAKYARGLVDLVTAARLPEQLEVRVGLTHETIVAQLVSRFGEDRARELAAQAGVPASLLSRLLPGPGHPLEARLLVQEPLQHPAHNFSDD